METIEYKKQCLLCEKELKGRTDKKFCNDFCRNSYNNRLRATRNNTIRNINNALLKNRRILEGLLTEAGKTATTHREELLLRGFLFNYHTHKQTCSQGTTYQCCYDFGYLEQERGILLKKFE